MLDMTKHAIKNRLGSERYDRLKVALRRKSNAGMLLRRNLPALARFHGTDKWGRHRYAKHYQSHFWPLRKRRINLLEIGVGGHDNPEAGGNSLRMWRDFFPRARVYGLDIFDKSPHEERRIQIFRGSQNDPDILRSIVSQVGPLHLIIDDGSHVNEHVLTSFQVLFPLLAEGGIYAIEDLQTSYWPAFGGTENCDDPSTGMGMLKRQIDGLNWEEFHVRKPGPLDRDIASMHFYHNLAFIYKAPNVEGSNKNYQHRVHTS